MKIPSYSMRTRSGRLQYRRGCISMKTSEMFNIISIFIQYIHCQHTLKLLLVSNFIELLGYIRTVFHIPFFLTTIRFGVVMFVLITTVIGSQWSSKLFYPMAYFVHQIVDGTGCQGFRLAPTRGDLGNSLCDEGWS